MMDKYILDADGNPKPVRSLIEWAMWYEHAQRTVARERTGDFEVSTVFLSIDHSHTRRGKPVLWETCVFDHGKPMVLDMFTVPVETCESEVGERYTSRADALRGHARALDECRALMRERVEKRKKKAAARKVKP